MTEKWLTIKQTAELTGKHEMTIRNWVKQDLLEWRQMKKGVRRSPIYISYLSIPTFLRKGK